MQVPIAEGLFTGVESNDMRLLASRCTACDALDFPATEHCVKCGAAGCATTTLDPVGTLWTWTTQEFPPPSPPYIGDTAAFEPFLVGYVEIEDAIRVETRLTDCDVSTVAIGAPMRVVPLRLRTDSNGDDVTTFAFAPVGADT